MKFLGFSRNNNNNNKIPEINIIECEMLNNNYVTFEYEMIQRAREAECILNHMLYNDITYAPYSKGTLNSTFPRKIKSNKFGTNIPIIKIEECDEDERDEDEMEIELIRNAQRAKLTWKELLESASNTEKERPFSLHISTSEPIISTKKTKDHSKVSELYGTLSKYKAKHFKLKSKSYSLVALNDHAHIESKSYSLAVDDSHNESKKKRKVLNILPKFTKSKTS